MHHNEPTSVALPRWGGPPHISTYEPNVGFVENQTPFGSPRMDATLRELQAQRRFYYGIEILAGTKERPVRLDFYHFMPVLPIFVSIAWLGRRYRDQPIEEADSLVLAKHLAPRIHVIPHLTAYDLTEKRLDAFLALNFSNMLALRGDAVDQGQPYKNSMPILKRAKKSDRDFISVFVAGHPEGYYTGKGFSDIETHINILKDKIENQATGIITQVCYRPEAIINFVKRIRSDRYMAETPILVGIMIHTDFDTYKRVEELTGAKLPDHLRYELEWEHNQETRGPHRVRDFFIRVNVNIIRKVMEANIDVYGFQFYTLNNFAAVESTLDELHTQNILNGKKDEIQNSNQEMQN